MNRYIIKHIFNKYVLLVALLGTGLYFFNIGKESYWLDEISNIAHTRNWDKMLHLMQTHETNMWLFYIFSHFWLKVSEHEAWLRSLSALAAVATIPSFYYFVREMFKERAARIATALLAVNTYVIFYAQEARSYSFYLLFATLSSYFYLKAIKHNSRKYWIGFVISTLCSIYSHLNGAGILFLQDLYFLILRDKKKLWRNIIVSNIFIGICISPLIIFQHHLTSGILQWIPVPTLNDIHLLLFNFSSKSIVLEVIYILLIIYGFIHYRKNRDHQYTLLIFLAPILIVFIESIVFKPAFIVRYFIASLAPFLALVAAGLDKVKNKTIFYLIVTVIFLFSGVSLYTYYSTTKKTDWRGTAVYMAAHVSENDAVLLYPEYLNDGFNYYYRNHKRPDNVTFYMFYYQPTRKKDDLKLIKENVKLMDQIAQKHNRLWFITGHISTPQKQTIKENILKEIKKDYIQKSKKSFSPASKDSEIEVILYESSK